MITLVTLFGKALNLNGDQGNVFVLADFLRRCGIAVQVIDVQSSSEFSKVEPDFVFIGHGSAAAHKLIDAELAKMRTELERLTCPIMLVGSGVEFALETLGLSSEVIVRGERESFFAVGKASEINVLGYRNTDSGLPNIWIDQKRIFTMLHGPVLAKNPRLLNLVANLITRAVPLASEKAWFSKLNELCERIWQLETQVAFDELRLG